MAGAAIPAADPFEPSVPQKGEQLTIKNTGSITTGKQKTDITCRA